LELYEEILRVKDVDSVPVVLCGNKCDVNNDLRRVKKDKGSEIKWKNSFFTECSAKNNTNINIIFEFLVKEIRKNKIKSEKPNENEEVKKEGVENEGEKLVEKGVDNFKEDIKKEKKKGNCILS
jgi:GTPase SAR1 family protein